MADSGAHNVNKKQDGWSTIHRDILDQILKRLHNVLPDLVQFGAVCKHWQSVLLENHPALATGVPLLMLVAWSNVHEHAVLDISTNKLYRLPPLFNNLFQLHKHSKKGIMGSSFGWLVTREEDSVVQLRNPITRAYISLPPANTFSKIVLSSDPRRSGCMAMAFSQCNRRLSFCRIGDQKWTKLGREEGELCSYDDLVYHKGLFYAITQSGAVVAWELTPEPKMTVVAPQHKPEKVRYRCLSSADNDLLVVVWGDIYGKNQLYIRKLNLTSKKWEEVKSLDDRTLFATGHLSMLYRTSGDQSIFISISTNEMYGCRPNCIYFVDMSFYDLEDKLTWQFFPSDGFLSSPVNWITLPQV